MSSTDSKPIVIACAADEHYVMPLAAMIKSVLTNVQTSRRLSLYIVDGGIDENDKERLVKSWALDRLEIQWVLPDHSLLSGLPLWGRMNISTYYRLMISTLLPESCGKAIWLDSDMIVEGNLAELWEIDLGNKCALAVQDLVIPYVSSCYGIACYKELGIPRDAKYFNAGVMVVNLDWWRQQAVTDRVLAYLRKYRDTVCFWDQEGLNAVLAGQWGELDPRWNQISSVSGRSFFSVEHLDQTAYQQVVNDPWIVHFAGTWKPWVYHNNNPARALYFRYLDMTVWAGWRPRRTLQSMSLGIYEAMLREILYPAEKWRLQMIRRRALHRDDC
jgi:lipopolysaccharide biosynthesis glycosyltransferase